MRPTTNIISSWVAAYMLTSELQFLKTGETHQDLGNRWYDIDKLIDVVISKPRAVEDMSLVGWFTERGHGPFGLIDSFLVSPDGDEHIFSPSNLLNSKPFPVFVCKTKRHTTVIDGIHRVVKAIRSKKSFIKCVYVTPRELRKCVLVENKS